MQNRHWWRINGRWLRSEPALVAQCNQYWWPGIRIRIRIWSVFNQVSGTRSGSRRAKMTHKSIKKIKNLMFWSAGCSLLRAEGFFCNFMEDLGLVNGCFWSKKINFLISCKFFFKFWSSKPWIRIGIQPKMLDPDPFQMKTDPKPCWWRSVSGTGGAA